jgi:hypothetical protein
MGLLARKFLLDVLGDSFSFTAATATIDYSKARGTKLAFALENRAVSVRSIGDIWEKL